MAGNVRTPSTTTERNFQVKTKEGDPQAAYLEDKIDGSTYINITEGDGTYGKKLVIEADISAINDNLTGDKVRVSDLDPIAEYLKDKITAGTGIKATCNDDTVTVALDAELKQLNDVDDYLSPSNRDILVYSGDQSKFKASFNIEETFSGTEAHVPSSDAVSDLLQTCMITDDNDLGTGGDALMWHAEFMEPSRLLLIYDSDAIASNIIDGNFPKASSMIAATPTVGDNGDGGFSLFGNFKIITKERSAEAYYKAALAKFFTHEFYAKDFPLGGGASFYLDLFLKLPATGAVLSELKLKIYPYYAEEGDSDFGTFYAPQTITVQYDGSVSAIYQWETAQISGGFSSDTNPQAVAFFITVQSEGATPTATYTAVNEVEIAGLRLRYPKRTIGLRRADVSL